MLGQSRDFYYWISAIYCLQASPVSISDALHQDSAKWIDTNFKHCLSASISRWIDHVILVDSYI